MSRPAFEAVRTAIWQALVARLAARPWEGDRIEIREQGWLLVLDSFRDPVEKSDQTRLLVALPRVGFHFRLARPHALSWVGSLFGLLDITIGEPGFDEAWLIKSSSKSKIRKLLGDPTLRSRIDDLDDCALSLEADESKADPLRVSEGRWDELVLIRSELQSSPAAVQPMFELLTLAITGLEALVAGGQSS